jgi:hypothetical protein
MQLQLSPQESSKRRQSESAVHRFTITQRPPWQAATESVHDGAKQATSSPGQDGSGAPGPRATHEHCPQTFSTARQSVFDVHVAAGGELC